MRWLLVVPVAILSWLLADILLPSFLQLLDLFSEHITLFLSHLAAVVSAGYVAPRRHARWAALGVVLIFVTIRLVMVLLVLEGDSPQEDIVSYSIVTLMAIVGLGLGVLLVSLRRPDED